nr:Pr6Pr family membrane protein [uncultured Ruminococcus sp.]
MKNRTAQLIYQSFYCAFALIGTIGSVGLFKYKFTWDFYISFTNISSYLCFGVMLAELIQTAKRKDDAYVAACPKLKFISMLGTLLTFLVFNFMLAPEREPQSIVAVECILFHMVMPPMFILDWFLFYEHGKIKWTYPLISTSFPLAYCGYVLIHAAILGFDTSIVNSIGIGPLIYPYFFFNPEKVGYSGIAMWVGILLAAFIVIGYLFFGIDKLLSKRKTD